jgi:hypothetical protein
MTLRKVCQVHDPDDVVPGRICGGPLPCREHTHAFPSGARVLIDDRDEAIVKEAFPEGSTSYLFPHYKVDIVKGDTNVAIGWNRIGVRREKETKLERHAKRPTCSGKWAKGSGAHRVHEPCAKPAAYYDSGDTHAYCEEHMPDADRKLSWDMRAEESENNGGPLPCREHTYSTDGFYIRHIAEDRDTFTVLYPDDRTRSDFVIGRLVALMNAAHTFVDATDDRGIQALIEAARDFTEAKP